MNMVVDIIKISPVSTERIDYSTLVFKIVLPQKLDVDNAKDLWFYLSTLITGGALKIYLEMNKLEYIDSSGIGVIINAAKMVRLKKGDIVIANISDDIRNIFKVINLENFIKIYGSEVEAVNSFRYVT
ncbi:MAG TPA: STAS domain-containing protein [Spirochaetota bacterium]|nr:STAS domain-containing protein [Spirochaetota bacterium]HOD13899.1 STAS domain-containing protein [Spirochaetota bacterium]HPG49695.1 STAS domain-containing protein [Spirochaetota bacterium]HPN13591.1 STAS domain-containing protein [Spirochaetota bacterium]HQL83448.1 STAS domain-containing protein [Spirochaetota bacterium]